MRTPKKRNREIPTILIKKISRDASDNAIMNAFNRGLPVTRMQGDDIVKVYPDGTTEFIKRLENSSIKPEKRRYHI
jgi:citrate lyase synthetase